MDTTLAKSVTVKTIFAKSVTSTRKKRDSEVTKWRCTRRKRDSNHPIYDLPIALGLLAAQELIPASALRGILAAGELALDGSLRFIDGAVNLALLAAQTGDSVLLPELCASEAALIEGVTVLGVSTLRAAVGHLNATQLIFPTPTPEAGPDPEALLDLLDIKGQSQAKRALEVSLAGGHNLLMVGSPGSGKTMLARRAPSLLPRLTRPEALEVTRIHSAAGMLVGRGGLVQTPPYRSPHSTVSDAGLIGAAAFHAPARFRWLTGACCFSMSSQNFHARRSKPCASHSKTARC